MAQTKKTTSSKEKSEPKKTTTSQQIPGKTTGDINKVEIGEIKEVDLKKNIYSREIKIFYTNPPSTGNLDINNQLFTITKSPKTVVLKDLPIDKKELSLEISFSDEKDSKKIFPNILRPPLEPEKPKISSGYAVIVFYLTLAVFLYFSIDGFQKWVNENVLSISLIAIIIIGSILITYLQKSKYTSNINFQIRLLFIIIIPFLVSLTLVFVLIPHIYHVAIFRSLFLLIVILLPAILYYLFLSRKKASLLQEFVSNLSRLGLLGYNDGYGSQANLNDNAKEVSRQIRLMSYIQKFELLYGSIPPDLAKEIIKASDPKNNKPEVPEFHKYLEGKTMAGVFTSEMIIPVIISTILIAIGWLMILPPWITFNATNSLDRFIEVFQPTKAAVLFAFLGAYFFSIQMLFRRYYRKDLRSNAYLSVILRFILAIIGTWAATQAIFIFQSNSLGNGSVSQITAPIIDSVKSIIDLPGAPDSLNIISLNDSIYNQDSANNIDAIIDSNDSNTNAIQIDSVLSEQNIAALKKEEKDTPVEPLSLLVIGFIIGVFPPIAWQLILSVFSKLTGAKYFLPSLKTAMPIRELDGLTIWHEAKLEEEDVENIQNMATANIVDLILNTGYPANRIIDWIDQAILYNHLGSDKKKNQSEENQRGMLRKHGIRTASALIIAYNKSATHNDTELFEKLIDFDNRSKIRSIVDTLENNPNLKLIQAWKGI